MSSINRSSINGSSKKGSSNKGLSNKGSDNEGRLSNTVQFSSDETTCRLPTSKASANGNTDNKGKEFFSGKGDHGEDRSVSSKARVREQLQKEMEEFMAKGGCVDEVDPNVTADPPKKPNSNYGSRPI